MKPMTCKDALLLLLDQVDFTAGACSPTEMVGACIPKVVLDKCRAAIADDKQTSDIKQ